MSKFKKYFSDKAFYKMALAIIIPVIIQQMILNIAGLIDTFMINRFSQTAYTGVSTANRFMFIINFFWIGLTAGISVFVSQYFGAKNKKGILGTFQLGLILSIMFGILSSVIITTLGPVVIKMFLPTNDPEQLEAVTFGIQYIKIIGFGATIFLTSFMISTYFRSIGRAKVPLLAGVIGIIINMSLNMILIYGFLGFPAMGAIGAAWATVISKVAELIVLLIVAIFYSEENYASDILKDFLITKRLVKMYILKGGPIIINEVLWSVAMVLYAMFITSGVYEWVTAYGYSQNATDIFFVYYSGMATASGVILGQALGENSFEKAKDYLIKLRGIMMLTNVIIMVLIVGLSPVILLIFTPVNSMYWLAYKLILINVIFIAIYGYNAMSYYALRAGGDSVRTFLLDQLPTYLVGLPVVIILSAYRNFLGIDILTIFLASKSTDIVKLIVANHIMKKGTWLNNLTLEDNQLKVS
ncbi:MATE family efflux transporter [Acholeplasma granularum]|uniref:MATE family efflux transporter n=1 Tax=Acholeplasma granularum TaxID=264635 RepID=UPI0004B84E89|nr:MATE family efflux transporter [Acholeplasma granularum]